MTEKQKHEGRLREEELEVERLKLKIDGLRAAMRDNLDPFEDVAELRLDIVASQATDALGLQGQLKAILVRVRNIKKMWGL